MTRHVDVVVTYLEWGGDGGVTGHALAAAAGRELPEGIELRREAADIAPSIARQLYLAVGDAYHWVDRASWTTEQWRAETSRDGVEVWTARQGEAIIGYFQLHAESDAVELKYFGLTPGFTGRGLGRGLLTAAIRRAVAIGPGRVTLNTCTLDHPAALPNYLARGFRVVRTETQHRTLPA